MPDHLTPAERSMRGRIASHESWARTADGAARTAPARAALNEKFEREVDPEGVLSPAERAERAENARKAYYQRLAFKSARSRRRQRALEAAVQADQAEAELSAALGGANDAA